MEERLTKLQNLFKDNSSLLKNETQKSYSYIINENQIIIMTLSSSPAEIKEKYPKDYLLVQEGLRNNNGACTQLMNQYKDRVYFIILGMVGDQMDAEDLMLVTFSKAFRNLEKYTAKTAFNTWLYKIAINSTISFLEKKKLPTESLDDESSNNGNTHLGEKFKGDILSPEQIFIEKERKEFVRAFVQKLEPRHRKFIELHYLEELTYKEIIKKLNISKGNLGPSILRARKKLEELLGDAKIREEI